MLVGRCDPRFSGLWDALEGNLSSGVECGLSFYVDVEGDPVVDLWGGWSDPERTQPWLADTVVNVWSSTKAVASLAALVLVDRGLLDLRAPVADYWPEFAQNGKAGVQVRHVLSHTSGVSGWDPPFDPRQMYDLEGSTALLAGQSPWWAPGSAAGYHTNNYGHLVSALVRRTTGLTLGEFIRSELAVPLHADFYLGVPDVVLPQVATLVPADVTTLPAPDADLTTDWAIQRRTFDGCFSDPLVANEPAFRRAEIGAANGHGNARGLGRIMSVVSRGGSGPIRLRRETIDCIFDEQFDGIDLVLALPLRWGVGFALESRAVPYVRGWRTCFWGGWGGSLVAMDAERGITVAYAMNQMHPGTIGSDVTAQYFAAVNAALDSL